MMSIIEFGKAENFYFLYWLFRNYLVYIFS
jgi:hypothetical protein